MSTNSEKDLQSIHEFKRDNSMNTNPSVTLRSIDHSNPIDNIGKRVLLRHHFMDDQDNWKSKEIEGYIISCKISCSHNKSVDEYDFSKERYNTTYQISSGRYIWRSNLYHFVSTKNIIGELI